MATAKKVGRRSKLNKAIADRIIEAVRGGAYNDQAAAAVGIGHATFYRWLEVGEADIEADTGSLHRYLREGLTRAQAECELEMIAVVRSAALPGVAEVALPNGRVVEIKTPGDPRMAIEYLKRKHPARWGNRAQVTVDGSLVTAEPRNVVPAGEDRDRLLELLADVTARPELPADT